MPIDAAVSLLSIEERWGWVCALCLAGKANNSGTFKMTEQSFASFSGLPVSTIVSLFEKLQQYQLVRINKVTRTDTNGSVPVHNITERTEQDTSETVASAPSSESTPPLLLLSKKALGKIDTLYPDKSFVEREVTKMELWLDANHKKAPKSNSGWTRFVLGWLERSWEQYRKSLPTVTVKQKDGDFKDEF